MAIDIKLLPCNFFLRESRNLKGGYSRFSGCAHRDDCEEIKSLKKLIEQNATIFEKLKTGQVSIGRVELVLNCPNYKQQL